MPHSFISECVTAYAANKLTASEPTAPRSLRKRVASAGGNIKWLEVNRERQALFHERANGIFSGAYPHEGAASRPTLDQS